MNMNHTINQNEYTFPPIPSKKYTTILPKGTALVLEGGGMRGYYSAGVFEGFMEHGIMFPYIAGVSAGAANVLSYISGQPMRSRQIVKNYACTPEYVSKRNLFKYGSMFNRELVFRKIPQKHVFFDYDALKSAPIQFYTGAMDCKTGEAVWFDKNELTKNLEITEASCAVPLIAPIVKYKGYELLDGGIPAPIPIEKSIEDNNTFHVIVLTQNEGYVKKPFTNTTLAKIIYRKYPNVVKALERRHEIYNRQVALCEKLEKENKAIIIRPKEPIKVGRTTRDTKLILGLYDEGHRECNEIIDKILRRLGE